MKWTETWRTEILALEARIAAAGRKEKKEAVKQLEKLRKDAVYAHCRREVLLDGRVSL